MRKVLSRRNVPGHGQSRRDRGNLELSHRETPQRSQIPSPSTGKIVGSNISARIAFLQSATCLHDLLLKWSGTANDDGHGSSSPRIQPRHGTSGFRGSERKNIRKFCLSNFYLWLISVLFSSTLPTDQVFNRWFVWSIDWLIDWLIDWSFARLFHWLTDRLIARLIFCLECAVTFNIVLNLLDMESANRSDGTATWRGAFQRSSKSGIQSRQHPNTVRIIRPYH